jgi:hypothetical protein
MDAQDSRLTDGVAVLTGRLEERLPHRRSGNMTQVPRRISRAARAVRRRLLADLV